MADDNNPRTFTFENLTAIRTGWNPNGVPVLVISEGPSPDEKQGRNLGMLPLDIGAESVVIEFRDPLVLLEFYEALGAIGQRMKEQLEAKRQ